MKLTDYILAQSLNGMEIMVALIPLFKLQNTANGVKSVEVGKKVRLQSGIEVELNLDGRTFYSESKDLFKLNYKAVV